MMKGTHQAQSWSRRPIALNGEMVERAAQALFEFVFAGSERLDGKHFWMNC